MDVYAKLKANILDDLLAKYDVEFIIKKLSIHRGTFNRWIQKRDIPNNYITELNFLLGNKYQIPNALNTSDERSKDQFYTTDKTAKYCYKKFLEILKSLKINKNKYHFIEPSAGSGYFYNLLPKDRRTGIDIEPKSSENDFLKQDYLTYTPENKENNIVVGNPPFGLRGNLALRFINHSYDFADVVAFILPQLFSSDGKGSTKKRVQGYKLAHSEHLPLDSFQYPDGRAVEVATVFQVWTKINTHLIVEEDKKTCASYIKIYSLSDGGTPSSTRNKNMLYKCDVYLPSTCFSKMRAYDNFEDLPHRRGYGIVFLKSKRVLHNLFYKKIDWEQEAFLSTNSALNLRFSLIENAIIKHGIEDK